VIIFLVERQMIAPLEKIGAPKAGNPGTDDGGAFHARR